jgi:murein DD-endopeptidase MepM/ murein hydrolase activator NlpD
MRLRTLVLASLGTAALLPASAAAATGGSEYTPAPSWTAPPAKPRPVRAPGGGGRPVATQFIVPAQATAGLPVLLNYQVDATAPRIRVRLDVFRAGQHRPAYRLDLGRHRTGRLVTYSWRSAPRPGTYTLVLHAVGSDGLRLARPATAGGRARLVVSPPETPAPSVPVSSAPLAEPAPASLPGTFPVGGAHDFGGADARFGAQRSGHIHQGQDVLAAEGTPVLAPRAGVITWRAYQASGAGYYLVLHDDAAPRDYVFMHLRKDSLTVNRGDPVTAGQQIGQVGHTGAASASHLHFEIWVGGWYAQGGAPVDPLPQLQAWDAG